MPGKEDNKITPASEHVKLQNYLFAGPPFLVALSQAKITRLSPTYHLFFSIAETIRAKVGQMEKHDQDINAFLKGKIKDNTITERERDYLIAAFSLENYLIFASTMTPGRQSLQRVLVDTLKESSKIMYSVKQSGGQFIPPSPISGGNQTKPVNE